MRDLTTLKRLKKKYADFDIVFSALDTAYIELEKLVENGEIESEVLAETPQFGELVLTEEMKNYDYIAFSDGACRGNPGPGAWGGLIQDNSGEIQFEGEGVEVSTTNNRMELEGAIACLKALVDLAQENDGTPQMALYSDSKYVVDGFKSWMKGWKSRGWKKGDGKVPENVDLWQQLDTLGAQLPEIQFYWVKGHSGHPQNERCDQIANKALDEAGF